MSVTIKQVLALPSFCNASLLAGSTRLDCPITAVTVLENACPNHPQVQYHPGQPFVGGELIVSSFASISADCNAQCDTLCALSAAGQSALVLYGVGTQLPQVFPQLIALAEELEFPLISMPEQPDFRYSQMITDVMDAIFRDQSDTTHLLGDILEQMTLLPETQRSVDTVLQLLSDRLRTTVLLLDAAGQVLGAAAWAQNIQADVTDLVLQARQGNADQCCRIAIAPPDSPAMELVLLKTGQPISTEVQEQVQNVLLMAVNLWSFKHAELAVEELVRAILRDEPLKMRRLAALFRLNVSSIHAMWLLSPADPTQREEFLRRVPNIASKLLEPHCQAVIAGSYQDFVIILADNGVFGSQGEELLAQLNDILKQEQLPATFVYCQGLQNTAQVRTAFLRGSEGLPSAQIIWPTRSIHTLSEIEFALHCKNHLLQDENSVARCRAVLSPLQKSPDDLPLVETLASYLLDSDQNIARCASLLFLHKNTVKYRYQQITNRLGYSPDKLPELNALYEAVSLYRLLNNEA